MRSATMRKVIAGLAIAAVGVTSANMAQALPAPEPTGFDDVPQVAIGGGSDTTYLVMQRLESLYNATPGCALNTTTASPAKGSCDPAQAQVNTNGNYDHDVMVGAAPIGSGAGINSLLSTGVQYNPPISYARSSRGPNAGLETTELQFWGYARDAIAVTTFGTRLGVSLTKQNLIDIYTCAVTDWSTLGGAPGTIIPWDMNSSSGTRATFASYIGVPFGTCVRKLSTGIAPFENDVKPLLADANTTAANVNDMIWWQSFGNWQTYPYTKNGTVAGAPVNTNLVTVDTVAPSNATVTNGSYPILRSLFHVTKKADAANGTAPDVTGADAGAGGSVREFTRWICKPNTAHATNVVTGRNQRTEIVLAINGEGFQQIPSALRTPGSLCVIP
jgi:ABC-type phosphate transport system substrate-binding protein